MSNEKIIGQINIKPRLTGQVNKHADIVGVLDYSSYDVVFDKNYLYVQSEASDEWVINHNLNKFPSVTVIDSAENEVIGDVEYIDENNLIIRFLGAFSGKATLN